MSTTANLGITLLEEFQSGKATTVNVAFTTIDAAVGASGTTIQVGVTTSTTLTNQNVVLADATAGAITVTLPASPATGQSVIIKKVDGSAHVVTVAPSSGTIDGAATRSLAAQNQSALLVYTASGWEVAAETAGAAGSVNSVNTRTGAVTLAGTDIPAFVASGASHAPGAVPDPGGTAGTTRYLREDGTWATVAGASGGTVTSVALTVPTGFAVSGSPVTGAGTLAVTESTQTANTVKAGPSSGGATTPTYRALVAADIPSLPASQITSGTISNARIASRNDAGNSGTALTVDWSVANAQKVTLTGNVTFTFSNPVAGGVYVLELAQDGTGSRLVSWPAAVHWSGGTAPTLTTTASKVDVITLYYTGASYLGVVSGLNYTA